MRTASLIHPPEAYPNDGLYARLIHSLNLTAAVFQSPWASWQIHKMAGCACAEDTGNVFPAIVGQLSRYAPRQYGTCVPRCMPRSLTGGFCWSWLREKRSRHSWCMCNTPFYVSGVRPMDVNPNVRRITMTDAMKNCIGQWTNIGVLLDFLTWITGQFLCFRSCINWKGWHYSTLNSFVTLIITVM